MSAEEDEKRQTILAAYGEVIREWATFEITLLFYLQAFLPTVDQFRLRIVWLALPNFQARRNLLRRFAETYLEGEALRKFNIILKRCSRLANKRNVVAHGLSTGMDKSGIITFVYDDIDEDVGVRFMGERRYHLTNIQNWPSDIRNLQKCMMDWYPEFAASVQASAKMHREQPPDKGNPSQPRPNP